jgi:hypothetical protein
MDNADNLNHFGANAIDYDVIGVDHGLTRIWQASPPMHERKFNKPFDRAVDPIPQVSRRAIIAISDKGNDRLEVILGFGPPTQLHADLFDFSARIRSISAIT